MEWNELSVTTTNEAIDAVVNILMENGAGGVQIDDSEGLEKVKVITYFPSKLGLVELIPELEEKIKKLNNFGLNPGEAKVSLTNLQDDAWVDLCKKYYHPVRLTKYLTIVPSWEEYQKEQEDEILIRLDPGRAFGTGTHPTTQLALQALETSVRGNESMIDVGTGSGVLSIAARHFGVDKVYAYDIDDNAVTAAKENFALNPISNNIEVKPNNLLEGVHKNVDLIVANILAEIIVPLIPQAKSNLKDGGIFITSGIINDKKELILTELEQNGFVVDEILNKKDWYSIIAHKPVKGYI